MHVSACRKSSEVVYACVWKRQRHSVPQVKRMHKCVGNEGKFVKTLSSWTALWGRGPLFQFQ